MGTENHKVTVMTTKTKTKKSDTAGVVRPDRRVEGGLDTIVDARLVEKADGRVGLIPREDVTDVLLPPAPDRREMDAALDEIVPKPLRISQGDIQDFVSPLVSPHIENKLPDISSTMINVLSQMRALPGKEKQSIEDRLNNKGRKKELAKKILGHFGIEVEGDLPLRDDYFSPTLTVLASARDEIMRLPASERKAINQRLRDPEASERVAKDIIKSLTRQ